MVLCRTIYWAEAGVIKSSLDNGSDITVIATELGNITAIDVSLGNSLHSALTVPRLPLLLKCCLKAGHCFAKKLPSLK